jgi:hypothetical protein
MDDNLDAIGVAGERLVDRVVDELVHHVMQAVDIGVADVHARASADSLQPFEDLDIRARIFLGRGEVFQILEMAVFVIV